MRKMNMTINRFTLIGLALVSLLAACRAPTYAECAARYGLRADTLRVPVYLHVPGDTAQAVLPLDPHALDSRALDSLSKAGPRIWRSGRARLQVEYLPATGPTAARPGQPARLALQASCDTVTIIRSIPCPPTTTFACPEPRLHERPPWWRRVLGHAATGWALLGLVATLWLVRRLRLLAFR
jgi:hypothetical protein